MIYYTYAEQMAVDMEVDWTHYAEMLIGLKLLYNLSFDETKEICKHLTHAFVNFSLMEVGKVDQVKGFQKIEMTKIQLLDMLDERLNRVKCTEDAWSDFFWFEGVPAVRRYGSELADTKNWAEYANRPENLQSINPPLSLKEILLREDEAIQRLASCS